MKVSEMYPSRYLRASDLPRGKDIRVTMDRVVLETMESDATEKPILFFVGKTRGLCLNKTTCASIAEL